MPGPAAGPRDAELRSVRNAECVLCHAGIADEHDASLHAASFTDASFQRGYVLEPVAFCRACHAPEADPAVAPEGFARSHGVACVTCHDPEGRGAILATRASGRAPHAVAPVADLGTRACVACHEFAFPGSPTHGTTSMMQRTAMEHAEVATACATCHMPPDDDGHPGHRFGASRDADLLARSVVVEPTRLDAERVSFALTAQGVGHAFPTGDLFRRLVLRVTSARGTVLEEPFGRSFRARDGVREEVRDRRLAPRQSVTLAARAGARWQLVYQRVTSVDQTPPFASHVESETELAAGAL